MTQTGDAVADITYRVRFSSSEVGSQIATLRRVDGAHPAGTDNGGQVIVAAAPVSTGRNVRVTEAGGYRFFAGWRSEPFFTNGRVPGKKIAAHNDLLAEFSYLGPPHGNGT